MTEAVWGAVSRNSRGVGKICLTRLLYSLITPPPKILRCVEALQPLHRVPVPNRHTAKIVIFTSSNEIEISAFSAWYRHSIGVLWFLGVLWTSGKVNCGHSDMSGECSHKIKCSHEKEVWLSWFEIILWRLNLTSGDVSDCAVTVRTWVSVN